MRLCCTITTSLLIPTGFRGTVMSFLFAQPEMLGAAATDLA
ncbi:PE family protein, partial [Mycobacterium tuberculosis]